MGNGLARCGTGGPWSRGTVLIRGEMKSLCRNANGYRPDQPAQQVGMQLELSLGRMVACGLGFSLEGGKVCGSTPRLRPDLPCQVSSVESEDGDDAVTLLIG